MFPLPVFRALLVLCLVGSMAAFAQTPLSVTQGRASQRAGTKLVDVYYDVSGGLPPYSVSVQGSTDGGATWNLPVTTVSGNVAGVTAGTNRKVTWDAGTDWAGQVSANVKFRVNVTDSATPPAPDGFALIPAGNFQMGHTSGDTDDGSPVTVTVSAFYMEKFEVTKGQWDEVRTWGVGNGYTDLGTVSGKASNHPVRVYSWYNIVKWCNARSQKDGLTPVYTVNGAVMKIGNGNPVANWSANGYRLPTEAEWEKAARGGVSGKRFPWGTDTISQSQANYEVYSSDGITNYYSYDVSPRPPANGHRFYHPTYATGSQPYTSPVGSFAANGYGLYDMAGNVWEWCWDWFAGFSYVNRATDPRGAASGPYRVSRGGSWTSEAIYCRASNRYNPYATGTIGDIGFRVARSSVP